MGIIGTLYIKTVPMLTTLRKFQRENGTKEPDLIPLAYNLLDETQLKVFEDYICTNTEFLYIEENLFDAYILPTMYTMRTDFKSTCRA